MHAFTEQIHKKHRMEVTELTMWPTISNKWLPFHRLSILKKGEWQLEYNSTTTIHYSWKKCESGKSKIKWVRHPCFRYEKMSIIRSVIAVLYKWQGGELSKGTAWISLHSTYFSVQYFRNKSQAERASAALHVLLEKITSSLWLLHIQRAF